MTRSIKFRAWDADENKMSDGQSLKYLILMRPHYDITAGQTYLQFTGVCDKNEREIYEGDIVRGRNAYGESMTWEVAWEEDPEEITGFNVGSGDYGECEIVGNIYETPDLLN